MKPYFQRGGVTLFHADARDAIETLPDASIEVVLTDPPYSSGARRDAERSARGGSMLREIEDVDWFSHDTMTNWGFSWFGASVATLCRKKAKAGAHVYWFTDWRMTPTVYGMLEATGHRVCHTLVWDKTVPGLGTFWRNQHENIVFASNGQKPLPVQHHRAYSVLRCATVSAASRVHPTEKPIALLKHILEAAPLGRVLDPFAGSGSTLIAALLTKREAVGVELEERYCELIAKRLEGMVLS